MAVDIRTSCCLLLLLVASSQAAWCRNEYWTGIFNKQGLAKCEDTKHAYMQGIHRLAKGSPDGISLIDQVGCCYGTIPYTYDFSQVYYADWTKSFDANNRWNSCPRGYFVQGLYRDKGTNTLQDIAEGRCIKPASHPYRYGECYDLSISPFFETEGWHRCNDHFFITGIYRGGCNELYCLKTLKCCKMAPQPQVVNSLSAAKVMVMDNTMSDLAKLADMLGYGWCAGCRAAFVGEDFRRDGDKWVADKREPCDGYKADHRLSMEYGDWKFAIKEMVFGDPIIQDLQPEAIDTGILTNDSPNTVTHELERGTEVTRTVTHTASSEWKHSEELGLTVGYAPPDATGGFSVESSFTFNYEKSSKTEDANGKEQKKSFSVKQSTKVPANSAVKWTMILSKTRRTVPYTAKVVVQFSAELQGFLRWGGGVNGDTTNFHNSYKGSGARPTFNYKFGSPKTPFYEALKEQSDTMQYPWLWADMEARYSNARELIESLSDEGRYEFFLNGKFDDISGKDVQIKWNDAGSARRRKRSADKGITQVVATEGANDPPEVFPPPPVVKKDPVVRVDTLNEMPIQGD
ncbi:uncharacterized protein LOC101859480 [Aplysia californica]|uniref:Uncharacterized protein LOC101859480 n=1 Tax=Aplysia californica TaxID=6500 RepID=A0ABM0JN39_APLCA|nr:uncharacterized protein LOC101859480 [Aplysia californica]